MNNMIICSTEFENNPQHEVDVYGNIPIPNDRPNHRLSVRRNEKGQFEAYRHFYPGFIVGQRAKEEVIVCGRLQDVLEITNAEAHKYWNNAKQDSVCDHERNRARRCRVERRDEGFTAHLGEIKVESECSR